MTLKRLVKSAAGLKRLIVAALCLVTLRLLQGNFGFVVGSRRCISGWTKS